MWGARTILWGVKIKVATLLKANFQRVDLFVFVELRSPVKPGMTCGTDMTMLLTDAVNSRLV